MKFSQFFTFLLTFIQLATSCGQSYDLKYQFLPNYDNAAISSSHENVQARNAPKLEIKYEFKELNSFAEAAQETQKVIAANTQNTTIVSTDSDEYLKILDQQGGIKKSDSTFVVYTDSTSKFASATGGFVKKSYQGDKVGFVIATYVTAVEVVAWTHVSTMSNFEVSANIAYTIALAVYFRLNKDKWTDVTKAIKNPMRKFFGDVEDSSTAKKLTYDYLANLALSTGISLARIPLMSTNQIIDHGISLDLFTMPLLLSIVGTASTFSWSEHFGQINKDSHPISRFIFGRAGEMRSVILATFASTAALLNPQTFGIAPWVALSIVGVVGGVVYLKSEQINNWIEKISFLKKYESNMRRNSGAAPLCDSLF